MLRNIHLSVSYTSNDIIFLRCENLWKLSCMINFHCKQKIQSFKPWAFCVWMKPKHGKKWSAMILEWLKTFNCLPQLSHLKLRWSFYLSETHRFQLWYVHSALRSHPKISIKMQDGNFRQRLPKRVVCFDVFRQCLGDNILMNFKIVFSYLLASFLWFGYLFETSRCVN